MHSAPQRFSQLVVFDFFAKPILLALNYLMSQQLFCYFSENQICQRTEMFQLKVRKNLTEKKSEKKNFQTDKGNQHFRYIT